MNISSDAVSFENYSAWRQKFGKCHKADSVLKKKTEDTCRVCVLQVYFGHLLSNGALTLTLHPHVMVMTLRSLDINVPRLQPLLFWFHADQWLRLGYVLLHQNEKTNSLYLALNMWTSEC